MPGNMGLQFGLDNPNTIYKQKFRWLFMIPNISAQGTSALPPSRAARPTVSFKELEVQHVSETIYYPGKPEYKPFNLTLYDLGCGTSPVMDWIKRLWDAQTGNYKFIINPGNNDNTNLKLQGILQMLTPCGDCIEKWTFDNCWPQSVDFQELDMGSSDVLMADITLRYDRAYVERC
jgi:hypothetical protein